MEIGIQFYTLRDFCKDLDSFSETLKKVADIGYKNVQISGIVQLFAMIPIVLFTPLARKAVARFGKKELATFGSIVSMISGLGLFIVLPQNTNVDLVIYIVCQLIFSLGLGIFIGFSDMS